MKSAEMPSSPQPAPADEAKSVFVNRLARLIELHQNFEDDLNPMGLKLLERSIYATYRDCIEFGAADQARVLLARAGLRSDSSTLRPGSGEPGSGHGTAGQE